MEWVCSEGLEFGTQVVASSKGQWGTAFWESCWVSPQPQPKERFVFGRKESGGQELGTAGVAEIPWATGSARREPAQIPAHKEARTRTAADPTTRGCDL